MRPIAGFSLWLGNAYEARDLHAIHSAEIQAVVDLALNEPPLAVSRELVYCRFPLIDGAGNPTWLLRTAVQTLANLLRANVPTYLFCSAGLSRSPVIAAVAIAKLRSTSLHDELLTILHAAPADVSAAFVTDCESASPF